MKGLMIVFTALLVVAFVFYNFGSANVSIMSSSGFRGGIGLGSVLAVVASWSRNKSILWAILHAFFGWIYVIYYIFTR